MRASETDRVPKREGELNQARIENDSPWRPDSVELAVGGGEGEGTKISGQNFMPTHER